MVRVKIVIKTEKEELEIEEIFTFISMDGLVMQYTA